MISLQHAIEHRMNLSSWFKQILQETTIFIIDLFKEGRIFSVVLCAMCLNFLGMMYSFELPETVHSTIDNLFLHYLRLGQENL